MRSLAEADPKRVLVRVEHELQKAGLYIPLKPPTPTVSNEDGSALRSNDRLQALVGAARGMRKAKLLSDDPMRRAEMGISEDGLIEQFLGTGPVQAGLGHQTVNEPVQARVNQYTVVGHQLPVHGHHVDAVPADLNDGGDGLWIGEHRRAGPGQCPRAAVQGHHVLPASLEELQQCIGVGV